MFLIIDHISFDFTFILFFLSFYDGAHYLTPEVRLVHVSANYSEDYTWYPEQCFKLKGVKTTLFYTVQLCA